MKVVIDIPKIPTNDKQRWALSHGTPYEERPRGEWVFDKDGYFSCSCCKKKPKYQIATTYYCPNCGADMRKKEGETETWNGFHGQLEVPKGTFDKIWNDEEGEAE